MEWHLPELPVSCGALIFDEHGRLLILKPTYKSGWTIPGGVMEANGETAWDACRREVLEETGLTVQAGRLVAVDSRPAKPERKLGLRFLFECGALTAHERDHIVLQESEISEHRFVDHDEAMALLRKAIRRRVDAAWGVEGCVYLENGRPVDGVAG